MSDSERARPRPEELARWSPEEAAQRLATLRERLRRAHLSAAEAHEKAAEAHDEAAAGGIGDVDAHRRAAAQHRAARDADYLAAWHPTE